MGSLTLSQGSSLYFEFNSVDPSGTKGVNWDLIDLGLGMLNLGDATAANTIDLYIDAVQLANSSLHATSSGQLNFDPQSNYEWLFIEVDSLAQLTTNGSDDDFNRRFTIYDNINSAGVFDTGSNNPFTRPSSSLGIGTFSVAWDIGSQGAGMYVRYSAIPEPGSMMLAGLASLGAGWYGRRRLRRQSAETATQSQPTT